MWSSPNSQRSARCHLSEIDLTRQRLVTFLREEMCAAVLQGVEAEMFIWPAQRLATSVR